MTETPLTPENWNCIDGMIYQEKEKIYLIFSHSFEDVPDGDMCMVELEEDLSVQKVKLLHYSLQKMRIGLFRYLLQKQSSEWMETYTLQMDRQYIIRKMENY